MDKNPESPKNEELNAWIKKQRDAAVSKFTRKGSIDSLIVEAKPAWVLPFQILIGKIRAQGLAKDFDWFICGELPTDYLASSVTSTPRETAKHFAMKWQLAAARHKRSTEQDLSAATPDPQQEDSGDQLAGHAEALYEVVEDDRLWL
jgi:hypothetical protein